MSAPIAKRPIVLQVPADIYAVLLTTCPDETPGEMAQRAFAVGFNVLYGAIAPPQPVRPIPKALPAPETSTATPTPTVPRKATRHEEKVIRGYAAIGEKPTTIARRAGVPMSLVRQVLG